MERKNGYLILDNEKIVRKIPRNTTGFVFEFLIHGEEHYFKPCEEAHALLEVFCSYVANRIEIPSVFYDIAIYQNQLGVLSKTYNPNHEKEISIRDLLVSYYINVIVEDEDLLKDVSDFDNLYNLDDIWNALDFHYKNREDKNIVVARLMREIMDSFLLQIILGNRDMHFTQLIILDGEYPHLTLNHDYGEACLVNIQNNFYPYALQVTMKDTSSKVQPKFTIFELLTSSDEIFIEYFKEKLNLLPSSEEVLLEMNRKLDILVSKDKISFFLKHYKEYCTFLKTVFDENYKKR